MAAQESTLSGPGFPFAFDWRRRQDVLLSFVVGALVALLMLALPMPAALASAVVGAFVVFALVDTRVAVFALILVRATVDVTATIPLVSASRSSDVNAAAMLSLLVIALTAGHVALNHVAVGRIPLVKPFALFLALAVVGIAVAPDQNKALQEWLRLAGVLCLYVLVVDLVRSRDDVRIMLQLMLLSSLVPLSLGIYQYVTDTGNHETEGFNRIEGTFVHPSPYASYLLQLLPLAVVIFIHTRSRLARLALAAMIPVMVFSIYATQTRVAWIGLAVIAVIFMATRARWTLLFVPLIAGALFFALPGIQARFGEVGSNTSSVFWRQKQWENALQIASPVQLVTTGAGLDAIEVRLNNFAHNEYLRLLVETGIPGLAAMLFLYAVLFRTAMRGYRSARTPYQRDLMLAFLMAFVARAVIAASDNIIAFPVLEWYFWSFAAVIVVVSGARDAQPIAISQEQAPTEEPAAA